MLVLERLEGERILIGDDIAVTVVEVRPCGKVRLGIDAPRSVAVDREEIRRRKVTAPRGAGGAA